MALPAVLAAAGPWIGAHLGEIGTALGGVASVGSMFGLGSSGGTDVHASMKLMEHQGEVNKAYTQWLNENQYSQLRKGLESAGYNPLLALGASPAQGSVGQSNAISGTHQDLGSLLSAMSNIAQIKLTEAQTKKINTNTVEKILDNVDTALDKLNLPPSSDLIKGLTGMVADISQNSSTSENVPMLKGAVSKVYKGHVPGTFLPIWSKDFYKNAWNFGTNLGVKARNYLNSHSSYP